MEWLSEFGAIAAMQGFNGLSVFCVLLLMALGLAIIFGQMGVINMAHGEFLTIGAYTTYVVSVLTEQYAPFFGPYYFFLAIVLSFFIAGAIGWLAEWAMISKLYQRPLDTFPLTDILVYKLYYQKLLGMKVHHPLNLVPYVKNDAEDELNRRFGWQRFQHKHHESRFTRFYEDYWLPRRFGFHKRRAHFSSLIMTGQMTREAALQRLASPEMDEHFLKQEFEYVAHKLDMTVDELQQIFEAPRKTYRDYRNKRWMIGLGTTVLRKLGLEKRHFR